MDDLQLITPALQHLRKLNVEFQIFRFDYLEKGGTGHSSSVLGVSENQVIKTLVFQDQDVKPLIVLMHGDFKVDLKALAQQSGRMKIRSCSAEQAESWTGYQVGGTSPFGLAMTMPIFVERTVLTLPKLLINGGGRGLLVEIRPSDLARALKFQEVQVGFLKDAVS